MKAFRRKGKIDQRWQAFLSKTNGSLSISRHCLERVAERFPEMLEMTKNEFLTMVRSSKPLYIFYSVENDHEGIIVRKGKVGFAVSFNTAKVMTTFRYKRSRVRQIRMNVKGGPRESKSVYHRTKNKKAFLQELEEDF